MQPIMPPPISDHCQQQFAEGQSGRFTNDDNIHLFFSHFESGHLFNDSDVGLVNLK